MFVNNDIIGKWKKELYSFWKHVAQLFIPIYTFTLYAEAGLAKYILS